ncbi:MAG TPA: tripartite tricarboxylate transporter substrate binding protein [Burkholderiaceae bacterium]|nr:tripartite tricarboxylate transporter substrate binding protein [Burkholderiaceae bacterium]
MILTTRRSLFAAALAALAVTLPAQAADPAGGYPDKAVKIIVPYPPGGFNDTMARIFGRKLQDAWGQPFIVDNKPGAGTMLGTEAGAKAPPDGYTLTVVGFPLVVNQHLQAKINYDSRTSFAPIIAAGQTPNLLLVNAASPIKTVKDLVDAAKANPGKLSYASAGNGTSLHLAMEYFKSVTGTNLNHIPYKGSAPMVTDLLGGQVDVMFDNLPNALPHVKSGRMRALGVTSEQRLAELPDLPTVAEQGYPGFEVAVWYGLAAPAGTPAPIIAKLNAALNQALAADDVKQVFAQQGVRPLGGSVGAFKAYFEKQDAKWSAVIKKAGIQAD